MNRHDKRAALRGGLPELDLRGLKAPKGTLPTAGDVALVCPHLVGVPAVKIIALTPAAFVERGKKAYEVRTVFGCETCALEAPEWDPMRPETFARFELVRCVAFARGAAR
jgi:hypothetical protein